MQDGKDIGLQAAREVRDEIIKLLEDKGPSLDKVLLRLRQELSAKEIKAQYDKEGGWQYSKALIAHNIRLRAVQVALNLHDAMPSEKHEVKHDLTGLMQEIVDKVHNERKDADKPGD